MSETLMTDAATTTEGATSQPAAPAPATADANAATQQQAAGSQTTDAGQSPEGDGKLAGDQATTDAKTDGAPEKYELALPDGVQMDEAGINAFTEVARELNLTQEAAQKVLEKMAPAMAQRQSEAIAQVRNEWAESARGDKEFGGEQLAENLSVAKKALDTFGTPELRTLLNESGLGNHPEIIRAFFRAGKAISEDKFVPAGNGSPTGSKDFAKSLYPNQQT